MVSGLDEAIHRRRRLFCVQRGEPFEYHKKTRSEKLLTSPLITLSKYGLGFSSHVSSAREDFNQFITSYELKERHQTRILRIRISYIPRYQQGKFWTLRSSWFGGLRRLPRLVAYAINTVVTGAGHGIRPVRTS